MDWLNALLIAVIGSGSALGGAALNERGQTRRAERSERAAAIVRQEARQIEHRDRANPAAQRLLANFGKTGRLARPKFELGLPDQRERFGEVLDTCWREMRPDIDMDTALLPDAEYRRMVGVVTQAIETAEYQVRRGEFASSYLSAVAMLADIGVGVVGSWLRGDAEPDEATRKNLAAVQAAGDDLIAEWEAEAEARRDHGL